MNEDSKTRYSIKHVSELTGVLGVTLRAWERRYGLLKPERNEQGHRLYTPEDVQRIRTIVAWLNQGVAISKVRPLLDAQAQPEARSEPLPEMHGILGALDAQDEERAQRLLEQTMKAYPHQTLLDQIVTPLEFELAAMPSPQRDLAMALWRLIVIRCCAPLMRKPLPRNAPECRVLALDWQAESLAWWTALGEYLRGTRVHLMPLPQPDAETLRALCAQDRLPLYMVGHQPLREDVLVFIRQLHKGGRQIIPLGALVFWLASRTESVT